jgi:hypothetical protein
MILDGKFKAGRGIPLPDGRSLDLIYEGKERGKGLYITNPDDFPELPKLTNFNPQEIIDLISAKGYFDLDKAKRIFPIGGTQPSDFSSPPQSGTPGLTARQQKALAAFEIQTKRKPTKQELQSILTKYK